MMMRSPLFLIALLFFISCVSGQELCDDGSLNSTSCNPCAIKANQDQCQAISPFHVCSARNCDSARACSFECECRLMCTMQFIPCEPACGPGFRCGRAPCSCEPMCVPAPKSCTYANRTFEDGETFRDDCNECWCNDGVVGCTKKGCPSPPTCPAGKTWTRVCPNSACALLDCMEGNDCEIDHCDSCEAKCKPNYCMVKGKQINNGKTYIDGCKRCICENGVTTCGKPDPKCVKNKATCPYGRKFEQVCEDKCADIAPKCEADMIPCQIDQCNKCEARLCLPRPCRTLYDCSAEVGQVCYFKNKFVAGVCRTFDRCTKQGKCAPGSTPRENETNGKCYCIPNGVSTNGKEFNQQIEAPESNQASVTSASTVVALVAAAAMF